MESKGGVHLDKPDLMDIYGAASRLALNVEKSNHFSLPADILKSIDVIVAKVNRVCIYVREWRRCS
jgi:hypothetical protein